MQFSGAHCYWFTGTCPSPVTSIFKASVSWVIPIGLGGSSIIKSNIGMGIRAHWYRMHAVSMPTVRQLRLIALRFTVNQSPARSESAANETDFSAEFERSIFCNIDP